MNKDKWAGLDLKTGDRVRIVIEDEVTALWPAGGLDTLALDLILAIGVTSLLRARVTIKEEWGGEPYESTLFVRKNRQAGEVAYIPASSENLSFSNHDVENGSVTVEVLD